LNQSVERLACLFVCISMSLALPGQTDSISTSWLSRECNDCNNSITADSFCMLYEDSLPVIIGRIQKEMGTDADFRLFARLYNTIKLNTLHVFCGPHMLGGTDDELEKLEYYLKIVLDAKRTTDYYKLGHFFTKTCRGNNSVFYYFQPIYDNRQNRLDDNYNKVFWLSYKLSKFRSPNGKCRRLKCKFMQVRYILQRKWLLAFRRKHRVK
jgi:hypothetical protein